MGLAEMEQVIFFKPLAISLKENFKKADQLG
jgi:hypothetical protein